MVRLKSSSARALYNVINILPVKPFESVMVIKGYTNKIDLN